MSFKSWAGITNPVLCGLVAKQPTTLSLSMHNAAFKALGLNFSYVAFDTEDTVFALEAMWKLGMRGLSLTIPHKELAVPLVDELSKSANVIRAVNTVINDGKKLVGYNTDWIGVREAFREQRISVEGKKVLIFGAGGVARAVIYAMKKLSVGEISITNRTDERAQLLAKESKLNWIRYDKVNDKTVQYADIFINCTPTGSTLGSGSVFPFSLTAFGPESIVFDLVTKEANLTRIARAEGATVVLGSRMLLYQAIAQFKLFTGKEAPAEVMDEALQKALVC